MLGYLLILVDGGGELMEVSPYFFCQPWEERLDKKHRDMNQLDNWNTPMCYLHLLCTESGHLHGLIPSPRGLGMRPCLYLQLSPSRCCWRPPDAAGGRHIHSTSQQRDPKQHQMVGWAYQCKDVVIMILENGVNTKYCSQKYLTPTNLWNGGNFTC